jgi:hypothetical protein
MAIAKRIKGMMWKVEEDDRLRYRQKPERALPRAGMPINFTG